MPGHAEIATRLRAAIERGDYPPGSMIPKLKLLAEEHGADVTTVRRAISVLQAAGLVVPKRGVGTFVRDRRPIQLPAARYADTTAERGPWETACAQQGLDGWARMVGVSEDTASRAVASALSIDEGAPVIRRDTEMGINDQVAQLQTTWLPLDLFAGTPLAQSGKLLGGIYRACDNEGHRPSIVDETVTGRMPTQYEAERLSLGQGSPVQDVRRTTRDAGGRAIVHVHIVLAADRVTLTYRQVL